MIGFNKNIIVFFLLAGIAGYFSWQKTHEEVHPAPAMQEVKKSKDTLCFEPDAPQLAYVKTEDVKALPEPLAEPLNAHVAYDDNRTARIFSPITGRVIKILSDVGMRVKAGDGLLMLDAPDYAQAVADASRASVDLKFKQQAYARAKQIFDAKGLALKDLESAESDLRDAEAEDARAHARLGNLNVNKPSGQQYVLRAPQSGLISERQASIGSEVVADAANPQFVITDPSHLWVMVDLPEQEMSKLKVGQSILAEVDAYPGEAFKGKVSAISGALDPVTRRIQVRCEVENPAMKLKPEMYAEVTPIADDRSLMPRIPNTAIFTQGLYTYVFVEQDRGVFKKRKVNLGLQGHPYSYVKEGLKAGERIVSSGALLLNSELAGNE